MRMKKKQETNEDWINMMLVLRLILFVYGEKLSSSFFWAVDKWHLTTTRLFFSLLLFERNGTLSLQDETDAHMKTKKKNGQGNSRTTVQTYRERENERTKTEDSNESETDELERKNIYMKRKRRHPDQGRENYAVHGPLFAVDCCWESVLVLANSRSIRSEWVFNCFLTLILVRRHAGSSIHSSSHRRAIWWRTWTVNKTTRWPENVRRVDKGTYRMCLPSSWGCRSNLSCTDHVTHKINTGIIGENVLIGDLESIRIVF